MLKKISIAAMVLVAGLVILVATRPSSFAVERSATIAAPPDTVFALVNDFHAWPDWSPWDDLDPNMETTFSGAESGTGAIYEWSGNEDAGVGSMTITKSQPPEAIEIDLKFIEPFTSQALIEFAFAPDGGGTKVTWTMSGENDFMGKAFSLVVDMDEEIGRDFEKGLKQLEAAATAKTSQPTAEG